MCLYDLTLAPEDLGPATLFSTLSTAGYGSDILENYPPYSTNNDSDALWLPTNLANPPFPWYTASGYNSSGSTWQAFNAPYQPAPTYPLSATTASQYGDWFNTGRDGDSDFEWAPIPIGFKDITLMTVGYPADPSYVGVFNPTTELKSVLFPIHSSGHPLIDVGRARFEYHAYINLITEFVAHSGTFVGKTYNAQIKIKWYAANRSTLVGETVMPLYSIHNAKLWKDPNLKGPVPYGARYFRIHLIWNITAGVSKSNFYGQWGFFLDFPTATDNDGNKLGLYIYYG